MMMMVSMTWLDSLTVGLTDKASTSTPTDSLLDRIDQLPEPVGCVHRGVIPNGEVQRRVDPAGELSHPALREHVGPAHRVGLERPAQARHRGPGGDPGRRRPSGEGKYRRHVPAGPESQGEVVQGCVP